MCGYENSRFVCRCDEKSTTEPVQSTPLAFQGIDNIHGGDGLSLGVLGVSDGIANNVLQENL